MNKSIGVLESTNTLPKGVRNSHKQEATYKPKMNIWRIPFDH